MDASLRTRAARRRGRRQARASHGHVVRRHLTWRWRLLDCRQRVGQRVTTCQLSSLGTLYIEPLLWRHTWWRCRVRETGATGGGGGQMTHRCLRAERLRRRLRAVRVLSSWAHGRRRRMTRDDWFEIRNAVGTGATWFASCCRSDGLVANDPVTTLARLMLAARYLLEVLDEGKIVTNGVLRSRKRKRAKLSAE